MAQTTVAAEELRRAFDAAFAAPPPEMAASGERLLSVRLSGESFALPMKGKSARISGLATDRIATRLPSPTRSFLGLIAVRGEIFPAYDLATIAGLATGAQRWWALLRLPAPAAVAFESLDGLIELAPTDLLPLAASEARDRPIDLVARVARVKGALLPVLDLDTIGEAIRRACSSTLPL